MNGGPASVRVLAWGAFAWRANLVPRIEVGGTVTPPLASMQNLAEE